MIIFYLFEKRGICYTDKSGGIMGKGLCREKVFEPQLRDEAVFRD